MATPSAGYDHIDIDACSERGIPVVNNTGLNAVSVAEHTIGLIVGLAESAGVQFIGANYRAAISFLLLLLVLLVRPTGLFGVL